MSHSFKKTIGVIAASASLLTGLVAPASATTTEKSVSSQPSSFALDSYVQADCWACSPAPLKDVIGNQFENEIWWLFNSGITKGYGDGTFRPKEYVSRGAMAAFFYRLLGSPAFTPPAKSPFKDVPTSHQFYKEIAWLSQTSVTTGYPDNTYRPSQNITRDAMAAFFYRLVGSPYIVEMPYGYNYFKDVKEGRQFYKEVMWMLSTGITTGYPDRTYRPSGFVTRDAMAAFLYRYNNLYVGLGIETGYPKGAAPGPGNATL